MKPIAIFYHSLLHLDTPENLLESAVEITRDQWRQAETVGLASAASEIHVGINGGKEGLDVGRLLFPAKSQIQLHGLGCKTENRTILMLEEWAKSHPGWYVLYFHSKGASHPLGHGFTTLWRNCMMRHTVQNWVKCVADLDAGYEAVGCHWMQPPETPIGHNIFAGTFFWVTSDFVRTLPSIMARDRIAVSGLDSLDSRYEAEVWLGNGPRVPRVKDYHTNWNPSKIDTCRL